MEGSCSLWPSCGPGWVRAACGPAALGVTLVPLTGWCRRLDWLQFSALEYKWESSELRDSLSSSLRDLPFLDEQDIQDVAAWSTRQQQVLRFG